MKNVLITGASGNLGKAAVEKFLLQKYNVIALVTPGKGLGFDPSSPVDTFEADLTNEESTADALSKVMSKFPIIDAVLLLVGGYASGTIDNTDSNTLRKMYSLNFETAYFVVQPLFQRMLSQGKGRIVFVGSKPGLDPKEASKSLAYGLSKSLIFHLAGALNATATGKNVTASVIVPSTIDTPPNRQSMPKADFSAWVKPEEIADAISFLCNDESSAWRGTVLKIYGNA